MKKIFTLLTAILLSASMATQAQESPIRDADVSATSSQIIVDETELLDDGIYVGDVTGPRKAPAATTYDMMKNSTVQYVNVQKCAATNKYNVYIKVVNNYNTSSVKTGFVILNADFGHNTAIGGTHSFSSSYSNCTESDNWFVQNYKNASAATYVDNPYGNIKFTFSSMGSDGYPIYRIQISNCYGYTSNSGSCVTWKNQGVVFAWDKTVSVHPFASDGETRIDFTDYYTISVSSNNNSYGTVSGGGTYAAGAARTLTASVASSSYQFLGWKKNGGSSYVSTSASYNVTVNGNDSYVAEFAPKAAPQYTITTAVSPSNTYGTVTGAGSYYENNPATLTATSANEHLYIFDHWLKDGNNYAGGTTITPTVTAAATYTAVFRAAAAGTITGVADHGTISGTGNYAGGTAVQLGVTAADGYVFTQWSDGNQDNPRTVYVDGNATYTAQFVEGVAINVEMGRLGVYDSNDAATMNDGSSGNAWFHIIGRDGEYEVRFESYGKYFSPGVIYGPSHVDESNSWVKKNGVKVPLNFSDISATATLNRTYGGKYGIYDISMRFVGTDGKIYMVSGQCVRAIYFDTADDYAFPKMDYNFGAPSYMDMIPEDYGPNFYKYTADGDGKWLYLKQSISGVDYYLRLCFKVAGNSIPTGTYHLNATGSGIPVGTAIPTILYDMSTTGNNWPNEVNGSCVFVWEQTGDENAYWWFLQYGTINVVNTNGVYYVEMDAINSFAEPVRFTMGTPPVTNHTVSITAPTNGTITVSYNDGGAQSFTSGSRDIAENTVLTITAEGATGYHFDSWTNDGAANVTVNNDKTIGATFAANAYTVTFNKNGGTGDDMTAQDFTYGTAQNLTVNAYTAPENKHFMGWATTAEGDVAYADGAEVNNLTATQNGEVELFAKWAYNTYTVVFNKNNEDATGTMANQAFTYGTAQNLTTNGFTLSGHDFAGWATEENGAVVYTNGEEVNNLTSVHEGTVNLYAKWIEIFVLSDSYNAGNAYYETLADKAGQTMNVRYERTFPAREWAAFSLPFGYSFQKEGNNTFRDQVYYLISAEYEVEGGKAYLTLNCMPNTLGIVANKPYVLIPNETIENPVFNNVKMKAQALNYYSVPCTNIGVDNPVETVEFRNTLTRMQFANNDHRQIYLVGSKLRYPNNGTSIRAFRGYFYMQEGTIQHIQPRLRNVETGEIIEAEEANITVETKKYIENGILVIERAGMKYDAQGHVIK